MMDQQRKAQSQQQRNHNRRPPDVEEALSSMLWTPYERTPTDSSSDDDDERLNRKLRKSQSSYEYYRYGGLTLGPPAAIMPFFGSNDPLTPFVPLFNHQDSVRNNNNINNNSFLSYSGTTINNNDSSIRADCFRKTDRCDNYRFSYPYYGPIPSLNKCLSVEPPSYDSLYSKKKDATRVLSNLVTVSTTKASGVLQAAYTGAMMDTNESYGRMVHSFTDNFVIECNSLTPPSSSPSTSSTNSVTHTHHQQRQLLQYNYDETTTAPPKNLSKTINDVKTLKRDGDDDYEHKANGEQKQTEVNQLPFPAAMQQQQQRHCNSSTKTSINRERKKELTQKPLISNSNSTAVQQRTLDKGELEERSRSGEPSKVSSLSTFVASGSEAISCRSVTIATTSTVNLRGIINSESHADCRDAQFSHIALPKNKEIIVRERRCFSSDCAKELVALAMRLNIPATVTGASNASSNVVNCSKNVSVTTSSVFLSNSVTNPNNKSSSSNSVAILASSSAPSLTIQVNDSCGKISNNNAAHGDFVVNQSIANNGISVVNCTYANSDGGRASSSKISSSSVPKSSKLFAVNNNNNSNSNQTDIQNSTDIASTSTTAVANGLQHHSSPTRTFTSTECQTDDIPNFKREDGNAHPPIHVRGSGGGSNEGGADRNVTLERCQLHPDALLSREQRRRERRERRQQQQQHVHQQQMHHQRLSRNHSHSHPPMQPTTMSHPAHHTMSSAAAALLRPMLPDILHNHFPPPYSALPLSQGAPLPPPPPPHATSIITPVISTVPIGATATMVGDGRFSIPLPIIRRSPSERSGKGCCGQWFAGPPLRALIAVVALGGVACAIGGAALGATGLAGPPSSHLTAALLMIGVGVVLVTVSGAAWRLTAPGGPPCLGLGSSVDLGRCGRRPCSRGGSAPHGLLYPEFQHRPPPPSYQASMQEYRLRLLLLDRDRQNGVVRGSSPPPTYRSHAGSLLRAPLSTTIRSGSSSIGAPGSEFSLPPSYRLSNTSPSVISNGRTIETAHSGHLLANEDIPESSICTIPNPGSSLPAYNVIISEDLHPQPQLSSSSSRNAQTNCVLDNNSQSQQKNNVSPSEQITLLGNTPNSPSTSKEFSASVDMGSLSVEKSSNCGIQMRELSLSEKFNQKISTNSSCDASNRTIGFLDVHSAISSQVPNTMTVGRNKSKDLVTIVTISAQDNANQSTTGEMEILAHL